MTKEEKEVMRMALELLAVGTFMNPRLQAERSKIINAGLNCLAGDAVDCEPKKKMTYQQGAQLINEMASKPKQKPDRSIESLLEDYWRLAFDEGKTGKSHGDAANEVLFALLYLYTKEQA